MARAKSPKVTPVRGDIFAVKIDESHWGAVRVADTLEKSILIATTPFLGSEPPSLEDPALRDVLVQQRFFCNGSLPSVWVQGVPPPNYRLLGNIGPIEIDGTLPRNCHAGGWYATDGNQAFWEWRWVHDNEAYRKEIEDDKKRMEMRRRAAQKPGKMLAEDVFWGIIGLLDWTRIGEDDQVLEPAVKALAAMKKIEIRQFQEALSYKLFQLDTKAHAREIGENGYKNEDAYFSPDIFVYSRCAAVANGRAFFEAALADPRNMPKDMEFEALLYLADTACEKKTGDALEHDAGCSFETFSNVAGWSAE